MKKHIPALIFLFLALIASPSAANAHQSLLKNLKDYRLANRLRVVLCPMPQTATTSIKMVVGKTGSVYEGKYSGCGISHLTEHLVFKGAEHGTDSQIVRRFHAIGAMINAYTDKHRTVFGVNVINSSVPQVLGLLPKIVFDSTFDQQSLDTEKQVVLREIDMYLDDPDRNLMQQLWFTAFFRHPYKFPVGGFKELFKTISLEDITSYYKAHYTPQNVILIISGGFDLKQVEQAIEKEFAPIKPAHTTPPCVPAEPPLAFELEKNLYLENLTRARYTLSFHGPDIFSPDIYALEIIAAHLGSGKDSELSKTLTDKLEIADSVSVSSYTPDYPGLFAVLATCSSENIEKVNHEVKKAIRGIIKHGISHDRLKTIKDEIISSRYFAIDTPAKLAELLSVTTAATGNSRYIDAYLTKIARVTPQDIKHAAQKYLATPDTITVRAFPKQLEPPEPSAAADPLEASMKRSELENGIRVITLPRPGLPLVSTTIAIKAGVLSEPEGQAGICRLTATMLERGTTSMDTYKQELAVKTLGGTLNSFSGYNSLGLSLDIPSEHFAKGFNVLAQTLLEPAFNAQILEQEKRLQANAIKMTDENLFSLAQQHLRQVRFGPAPLGRQPEGTTQNIETITAKDIKAYYGTLLAGPGMVITIVGDITHDQAVKAVSSHFSAIKSSKPVEYRFNPEAFTPEKDFESPEPFNQSIALQAFKAPLIENQQESVVFEVINSLLSGQGTILFEKIRDDSGAAYSVGSVFIRGFANSCLALYSATTQHGLEISLKGFEQVIEILKNGTIAPAFVAMAKNKLISQHRLGLDSNAGLAARIALDELYGLGFDNFLKFEERVLSVSVRNIQEAATKYFETGDCSRLILRGKE